MISHLVKILIFISIIPFLSTAQNNADLLSPSHEASDAVRFEGLVKTKASFLHRYLNAQNYASIHSRTDQEIQNDLNLLKNLPSVANAYFLKDTIEDHVKLIYYIEERKTALPILNFGGIRDNIWFSIGLIENNLRGNGDQLLAFYQNNDRRHSGQVYFKRPRIGNSKWGYSLSLHKWSSLEPLFFPEGRVSYLFDNNGIGVSILRSMTIRKMVELRGTFFKESYLKADNQELQNPPGPNDFQINKYLNDISYIDNGLNYDFFYLKGYEFKTSVQNVYNFLDKSIFNTFQLQTKVFIRPLQKLNLAARVKWAISTNNDSPFAPFVVDSHVNIRGVGNRIDRGTAQAVLNLELRYSIFRRKNMASQFVVFSDSGTWRNPGGDLKQLFEREQFRQFVGVGFRLIYQRVFGATLRVDYGIDVFNKSQRGLVMGLGQYF